MRFEVMVMEKRVYRFDTESEADAFIKEIQNLLGANTPVQKCKAKDLFNEKGVKVDEKGWDYVKYP